MCAGIDLLRQWEMEPVECLTWATSTKPELLGVLSLIPILNGKLRHGPLGKIGLLGADRNFSHSQ
jgi:hypothetical protein